VIVFLSEKNKSWNPKQEDIHRLLIFFTLSRLFRLWMVGAYAQRKVSASIGGFAEGGSAVIAAWAGSWASLGSLKLATSFRVIRRASVQISSSRRERKIGFDSAR
jgi:hypothetical protein